MAGWLAGSVLNSYTFAARYLSCSLESKEVYLTCGLAR